MIAFTNISQLSGVTHTMYLDMAAPDFKECLDRYYSGALIQDAFPMLNSEEREFIKTGITPDEWEGLMNQAFDMEDA
jgi:hypothetical protein